MCRVMKVNVKVMEYDLHEVGKHRINGFSAVLTIFLSASMLAISVAKCIVLGGYLSLHPFFANAIS